MNKIIRFKIILLATIFLVIVSSPAAYSSSSLKKSPGQRFFNVKHDFEETNRITGERTQIAWLEYNPDLKYMLELETGIKQVHLLKLSNQGKFSSVVERMLDIRERLEYAVDRLLLADSPYLTIELSPIERSSATGPEVDIVAYCQPEFHGGPNKTNRYYPLRLMTVTTEDAAQFAFLDQPDIYTDRSPEALAAYISAQIEAHFMLFIKIEQKYKKYEELAIDKVISGKIYREIFIRANDVVNLKGGPIIVSTINDALARIPLYQRTRLQTMSQIVPRDWKKSYRGAYFRNE